MLLPIDELNSYENKITDVEQYLEEYFEELPADEDAKEKRKQAALKIRDVLIFLIVLMKTMAERQAFDYEYILSVFRVEFAGAIGPFVRNDVYIQSYVDTFTRDYLDTTIEHLSMKDADYFWSEDRATIAGANEASSVVGYEELQEAIDNGYTQKMWVSQRDGKVRHSHVIADGQKKPIEEYFIVGGTALMIPCDPDCDEMKEVAGCRCFCKYMK